MKKQSTKNNLENFFSSIPEYTVDFKYKGNSGNILINGDNLLALKFLLENFKGKIDLVYIDPPFATNNIFRFCNKKANSISSTSAGNIAYKDKIKGENYIEFLRKRLILLRELLSEQGSIYLHIDYKIGHYVKVMMDEVFGIENFRNDITRIKCNPKNFERKAYGNVKDMILFYSKSANPIWNEPKSPYSEKDLIKLFPKIDQNGRRYTTIPIHAPGETKNGKTSMSFKGINPPIGRHWRTEVRILEEWDNKGLIEWSSSGNPRKKIYADEQYGKKLQDIWEFKDPQYPVYPTEKNLDLLKLIIEASSQENSIILDCFCGSGTTIKAAKILNRRWIAVDESDEAIKIFHNKIKNNECFNTFNYDFDYISIIPLSSKPIN